MNDTESNKMVNDRKWTRRSETYDKKAFDYFRYLQKRLISHIDLRENIDFLDLGCGTGWAVRRARDLLTGHGTFTGVDISSGMIQKANEQSIGLSDIRFIKASVDDIPLNSASMDTIICTNSFHHYPEPLKALSEAHRLMKPNGKLFILDLTSDDILTKGFNVLLKRIETGHASFYSTREYRRLFAEAKLIYLKSETIKYPIKVHIAQKK